jgi:midasin (ATPase involved in ribosome maturation)
MSPPIAGKGEAQGAELSPALYNRFTVIYMPDLQLTNSQVVDAELSQVCKIYLDDDCDEQLQNIIKKMCKEILQCDLVPATLRTCCRMIDFAFRLKFKLKNHVSIMEGLWTSYKMTVVAQISGTNIDKKNSLDSNIKKILANNCNFSIPNFVENLDLTDKNVDEHILTASRKEYAQVILACVECGMSVLLEGGAATGKTSLISSLRKLKKTIDINGNQRSINLEKVNNTISTSVQVFFQLVCTVISFYHYYY